MTKDWSHDLEGLKEEFLEEILPEWRDDIHESRRKYPKAKWIDNNGYGHLRTLLTDKHDLSYTDFCGFVLNLDKGGTETYDWATDDPVTIKYAHKFIERITKTRELAEATKRTYRASLNAAFRYCAAVHDEEYLYGIANDPDRKAEAYEMFEDLTFYIKEECMDITAYQYLRILQRWYEWLDRHHLIEYNPVDKLEEEFRFDHSTETTPLSDDQIRDLWREAESLEEHVLVVGYVMWGLRTSELSQLQRDQFVLDDSDDPRYEFEDRKNGPGTISVEHGLEYVMELFEQRATHSDYDGTLFDKISDKLKREFNDLADRADVTIDGDRANPQHGRNYWMDLYMDSQLLMLEAAGEIIPDRGTVDPKTALESYTDEDRRRQYRRHIFRRNISEALGDEQPLTSDAPLTDISGQQQLKSEVKEDLRTHMELES